MKLSDEALLEIIRSRLDWDEQNNLKPGTCGACTFFNSKMGGYDELEQGRCSGWRDVEEDPRNIHYVKADSTCERYHEDTSYLQEHKKGRPFSEKAHLAIMKRSQPAIDVLPMTDQERQEKLEYYKKWLEGR